MRTYVVRTGDSPASIASRADMAGCPKCSRDLVRVNTHKPTVTLPNGYVTFRELRAGETLNLPDEWFDGTLDSRPNSYFQALPYADGVTPALAVLAGVLGDLATFNAASARVAQLPAMTDQNFSSAVEPAITLIRSSLQETVGTPDAVVAQRTAAVQDSTDWAWQEQAALENAIAAHDAAAVTRTRASIQQALGSALADGKIALQAFYPPMPVTVASPVGGVPVPVQTITTTDPCTASNVTAVCAAQAALGVVVDGKWGANSATAAHRLTSSAPPACSPRPPWWAPTGQGNCPGAKTPAPVPTTPTQMSFGSVIGAGLLVAAAVSGTAYLLKQKRPLLSE